MIIAYFLQYVKKKTRKKILKDIFSGLGAAKSGLPKD
jgi:hypothetical protein